MQVSPGPSTPIWPPWQAPQVALVTTAPASIRISIRPAASARREIACAPGVIPNRPPLHRDLDQARRERAAVDRLRPRRDQEPHPRRHALARHHLGGDGEIVE